MKEKLEMTQKDLCNSILILGILKHGQEFSGGEIWRKSGLSSNQTFRILKFLRKELYIIPHVVPGEKNKLPVKYSISRRGMVFLLDKALEDGNTRKVAFTLSEEEMKSALIFINNHNCGLKTDPKTGTKKTGAIGGKTSYRFTPTSIGVAVTVLCACGKEENVTDYDSW